MLIECVPNVSEGRRLDVVALMADVLGLIPGVRLLDYSSDASHNRSVFTFAGGADDLEQAVLALFERAIADIDLRAQRGVHPRLGAVDVVIHNASSLGPTPLRPLADTDCEDLDLAIAADESGDQIVALPGVQLAYAEVDFALSTVAQRIAASPSCEQDCGGAED